MAKIVRREKEIIVYCENCNADYSHYGTLSGKPKLKDGDPCPECKNALVEKETVREIKYGPPDWCKDHGTNFNL